MAELLGGGSFRASPVEHTLSLVAAFKPGTQHYAIIFDDMHLVQSEEVRKSLDLVLSALPTSIIVVFVTQKPSDVGIVPEGRQDGVSCIDAEALAFSPAETVAYYQANGLEITLDEAETICSLTKGLAIDIVALASSGATSIGSQDSNLFEACIDSDFWSTWDGRTKEFLIKTSIVEVVTPEIAALLTEDDDAGGVLEELCAQTFFISRVEGPAYRYHHLLRAYLAKKAEESKHITFGPLYERAAYYYLENKEVFIARRCAMMSGNVDAIAKTSFEMSDAEGVISVAEFVGVYRDFFSTNTPEALCEKNPYLYSQYAGYYMLTGQDDKASRCYSELSRRLGTIALKHTRFLPDVVLMLLINYQKSLASIVEKIVRLPFSLNLGERLEWSTVTAQLPFAHRSGRDYSEFCEEKARALIPKVKDILGHRADALIDLVQAGLFWEQNRLSEAAEIIGELREPMRSETNSEFIFCFFIQSAALFEAMRCEGLADEALVQAEEFVDRLENAYYRPNFEAYKTRLALDDGDRNAARTWLDKYYVVKSERCEPWRMFCHFTTARAYMVLGQLSEAEELLLKLQDLGENFNRPIDVCESLALQASLEWALGRKDDAIDLLERALCSVQKLHIVRVFASEGAAILPILQAIRARCDKAGQHASLERPYLDEVLQATREQADRKKGVTCHLAAPLPKLSRQQKTVLGLIAQGHRNAEIARRTGLALPTVKFHLGEAYKKLGVTCADDAVAKAREVGLL